MNGGACPIGLVRVRFFWRRDTQAGYPFDLGQFGSSSNIQLPQSRSRTEDKLYKGSLRENTKMLQALAHKTLL
jgi:hypothetical protein